MQSIRTKVRAVVLATTGILSILLIFRVFFDLIDGSRKNVIVDFIHESTQWMIEPFTGIIDYEIKANAGFVNWDGLITLGIVIIVGILISEILTAFLYDRVSDIVQNVVDTIFKLTEFFLILRVIFFFFEIGSEESNFIENIYSLTNWATGITEVTAIEGRFEVSVMIVLTFVIVLDIISEQFIKSIFLQIEKPCNKERKTIKKTTVVQQPAQAPIQQTINVHVPREQK